MRNKNFVFFKITQHMFVAMDISEHWLAFNYGFDFETNGRPSKSVPWLNIIQIIIVEEEATSHCLHMRTKNRRAVKLFFHTQLRTQLTVPVVVIALLHPNRHLLI